MSDKKISELPLSSGIIPGDISVLVDGNTTEQYSFQQLLTFLSLNLQSGAIFTFGTAAIPSNTVGNNGDVYVKTDTGQFAQKLSGVWTVVYTIVQGVVGSTIYYGVVIPTTQGINGDTYLLTTNGTFYLKTGGTWVAQFSMATGPVGPAGADGADGADGEDGNTVLYGNTNPSNGLGVDGNFYINNSNYTFFGPKASGAWPVGVSLIGPPGESAFLGNINVPFTDSISIDWQTDIPPGQTLTYAQLLGNNWPKVGVYSSGGDSNTPQVNVSPISGSITTVMVSMPGDWVLVF